MTERQRDTLTGLMFTIFGCVGLYLSLGYALSFRNQIGPGVFPALLAGLLIPLGLGQCVLAARRGGAGVVDAFHLRPVAVLTLAVVAFGFLSSRTGIAPALAAAAAIAAFSRPGVSKVKALAAYVVVTAIVYVVLVKLIGLRLSFLY